VPVALGCATATFAASLATLPAVSSIHGSPPPLLPARDSANSVVDDVPGTGLVFFGADWQVESQT
jgi:hypothetical protein